MKTSHRYVVAALLGLGSYANIASADENLFGYIKGAETMPKGTYELDEQLTYRSDKGVGSYHAWDNKTELEYGVTDKFEAAVYVKAQAINTKNIVIDAFKVDKKINIIFLLLFQKCIFEKRFAII